VKIEGMMELDHLRTVLAYASVLYETSAQLRLPA
jgi:hypothetical protein